MVKSFIPETLAECLKIINEHDCGIVAGGTDMLIQNRSHTGLAIGFKKPVVYVSGIEELKTIEADEESIIIGAVCSLEEIMENDNTPQLLKDTILEMASPAIRHTATLAGNIGNASPAGDSLVSLYLMDTRLEIASVNGIRTVFLKDFITGVRRIALERNEMITKIIIPRLSFSHAYFRKVGPRLSDAISKLSFAGAYRLEDDIVKDIRLAFGAVNINVVRVPEIESTLIGKTKDEIKNNVDEIIKDYEPYIRPIDDQRSNKVYRLKVCKNLIREFIEKL
jgi:CO/xanthine dehydrogenase FAD-binding subunit